MIRGSGSFFHPCSLKLSVFYTLSFRYNHLCLHPMKTKNQSLQSDWQKNLVLLAKNTPVWLHQLSQKYQRKIERLDQIPAEELAEIAACGFNALWLVGVWQRSPASKKIKELYGKSHAIASAYSIQAYQISAQFGGEKSLSVLKENAHRSGMVLACDMVPNHTGLDSDWLIHHTDRYIWTAENPRTDFTFNTTNLSSHPDLQIYLEEGYYSQTGAAEVFKVIQKSSGESRFVYHGNDGTSMPWNDTAQLNYLNPETRRAVLKEILTVADQFDIIRLDAAMTLVKEHFRRLWFPSTAEKKCIPTRAAFSISQSEFDRCMPGEFWAEVIQAIAQVKPHVLLIAEAFWLMEKYFIQEIGMHRVYNSAFLHHLRDEKNQDFRKYIKDILTTDAAMLERFVNFLTTPDELSAADQFGTSDKYIGACRVIACLPGLPMFGHGQWEGLMERYGMDIPQPMLSESPNPKLVDQHKQLITPLLLRRKLFSSTQNFRLQNFIQPDQKVNANVIAFSNHYSGQSTLVLFNNCTRSTSGFIDLNKMIFADDRTNAESINPLPSIGLEEIPSNQKAGLFSSLSIQDQKAFFDLRPYESHVFLLN